MQLKLASSAQLRRSELATKGIPDSRISGKKQKFHEYPEIPEIPEIMRKFEFMIFPLTSHKTPIYSVVLWLFHVFSHPNEKIWAVTARKKRGHVTNRRIFEEKKSLGARKIKKKIGSSTFVKLFFEFL